MSIGEFLGSQLYIDFVVNDSNFPVDDDSVQEIIDYLLSNHRRTFIDSEHPHSQSNIHWFAHSFVEFQQELQRKEEKALDSGSDSDDDLYEYILTWDYPIAKMLLNFVDTSDNFRQQDGITQFTYKNNDEDEGLNDEWILFLKETLKVWLSLLKISLTTKPFDERLTFNGDELLIPRLTQDETELGFKFTGENAYENVKTREETILFIIQKMGQVYTERGNTEGYKKWIEFCQVHLQSVLKTSLVMT